MPELDEHILKIVDGSTYPYQVPIGRYFLMGDQRETSEDSRNSQIGCIGQDRMVGRILLRVWPLRRFGLVK